MINKVVIGGDQNTTLHIDGTCTLSNNLNGNAMAVLNVADVPVYTGQTVFTPTTEAQAVNTANMLLKQNIIIEPIPSNYGLVTWNGNVLTIS